MYKMITGAEFAEFMSQDMREMFELFVQQQHYIEVIATTDAIVLRHIECDLETSALYNLSYAFDKIDGKYAIFQAVTDQVAIETFYKCETVADALAFANTYLATVNDDI